MNMNRYGQYSSENTLRICRGIKDLQDIPTVIEGIAGRFLLFGTSAGVPPKRKYTQEVIDTAIQDAKKVSRERQNKEDIAGYKELFQRSVEIIETYLGYQEDNISNYDKFCLEIFLAGVSSHLNKNEDTIEHYKLALVSFDNAAYHGENWGDLSLSSYGAVEGGA